VVAGVPPAVLEQPVLYSRHGCLCTTGPAVFA
jgi:hypothetical protein